MRSRNGIGCVLVSMVAVAAMVVGLAACGGGGSGSTSTGTSVPATVRVSIASAPAFPAGTTFASSSLSPATEAPPANTPAFDNVFVTVTKLALIPSTGPGTPDPNGELEMPNSSAEEGKAGMAGFLTVTVDPPIRIDLRHLPGDNVATLLNTFPGVPAGEYSKIRVYYDNVVGHRSGVEDIPFHPTAHYHFDVHFVGGNLVIPAATDPQGGIRFYSVVIDLVGLKYHQAGNSGNILLRPQVFARLVEAPKYIVTGIADEVNPADNTFVVKALSDNVSATFGPATGWFYKDGRSVGPLGALGVSGADALRNTALVDVIGKFQGGLLVAEMVYITFPASTEGTADNVWIPPANVSFVVREVEGDNVVVFPVPSRAGAYYDNAVTYDRLTDGAVDNNVPVKARGYLVGGAIEAYWISIGGP